MSIRELELVKTLKKRKRSKTQANNQPNQPTPLVLSGFSQYLILINLMAISAGAGFGASIGADLPKEAGSSPLHVQQSFPPRQEWPISTVQK